MHLRTLIGPRAGEIIDFCPEAASAMLADGRAEMPSDDVQLPRKPREASPQIQSVTAAAVPSAPPAPAVTADVNARPKNKKSPPRRKGARR